MLTLAEDDDDDEEEEEEEDEDDDDFFVFFFFNYDSFPYSPLATGERRETRLTPPFRRAQRLVVESSTLRKWYHRVIQDHFESGLRFTFVDGFRPWHRIN